jgi:nucleoside diphosphate kinase
MMTEEITYVLITPYTIVKSRTGGVISRLLSRVDLEFCGAQIFAPSAELAEEYSRSNRNRKVNNPGDNLIKNLISDYVLCTFTPSEGRRHRVMMLLFRGNGAIKKIRDIVGVLHPEHQTIDSLTGETLRDTYGDLIISADAPDHASYFEPAVLAPVDQETCLRHLKMFASFILNEENIVSNMKYDNSEKIERTLVIIKPDNWRYPSSRPGAIIDMFSRTGLRIIGCKVGQMSVAQALEFYGPVESVLKKKLAPVAGRQARQFLEEQFNIHLDNEMEEQLTECFGVEYARDQFNKIINFMSGYIPGECPPEDLEKPGRVKSMILIYEGENAVEKIRSVLGPTDPTQAPGGTIRKEFGSDVMVNTAHASDSPENAEREMRIVRIEDNPLASIITNYLSTASR